MVLPGHATGTAIARPPGATQATGTHQTARGRRVSWVWLALGIVLVVAAVVAIVLVEVNR